MADDEKLVSVSSDSENLFFHSITFALETSKTTTKKFGWVVSPTSSFSYDDQKYIPHYLFTVPLIPHRFYIKDVSINSKPQITDVPDENTGYRPVAHQAYPPYSQNRHRVVTYNHGYEHIGPVELVPTNDNTFYGHVNKNSNSVIHIFELEPWCEELHQKIKDIL